jgi:U3 small nucleolar RNA-associated protein 14
MKKSELVEIIHEEVDALVNEIDHASIDEKLSELRESVLKNKEVKEGEYNPRDGNVRCCASLSLENVSRITNIPMNELMLYFINGQKSLNEQRFLVEMRMGIVYFYEK